MPSAWLWYDSDMKKLPAPKATKITKKYPDGCSVTSVPPLPENCPIHFQNIAKVATRNESVSVTLLLDRSGSMSIVKDQTIQGLKSYFAGLREDQSTDYFVTFVQFDDIATDFVYSSSLLAHVKDSEFDKFEPRGGTPLYDAITDTIHHVEQSVFKDRMKLFLIMSDGLDNASTHATAQSVKALIERKEAEGNWTFVYLGANQDAWKVGATFGMSHGNTMSYSVSATGQSLQNMAFATNAYSGTRRDTGTRMTRSLFQEANLTVKDFAPDAVDMGSTGGTKRMSGLSKEEKSALGKLAAKARWQVKK